jgi:hypothetical protein
MSRWIDSFDNPTSNTVWKDLKDKLELCTVDETIVSSVEEIARLKKIIAFIDTSLEGIEPELFPQNYVTAFNQQAVACRDQITTYNSNKNIAHITQANAHADNFLNYIRPHVVNSDKLKKSLLAAIRAYTNEVAKHLEHITDTKSEYIKVKEFREEIEEYYDLLFEDNDESIKAKITLFLNSAEEQYGKINKFYNEILIDEDSVSTKTAIIEAKKDILRDVEDSHKKLVDVSAKIEELDKFYIKIFGSEDEEGNLTGGLQKEIEQRLEALEKFKIEQEAVYKKEMKVRLDSLLKYEKEQQENNKNLYEQIEGYLPGATSAGLAKAYQEMKDSFTNPIKYWNFAFIGIVVIMFIATFISFVNIGTLVDGNYTLFSFVKIGEFEDTMNSILFKLPLYAPLIWLAIFASKRRSENQRLQQEYAHKEALAKSYISYKKQIDNLNQEDKALLEKLLDSSISTIAHNASESLDKKHGDPTPVQESLKILFDEVKKLKK